MRAFALQHRRHAHGTAAWLLTNPATVATVKSATQVREREAPAPPAARSEANTAHAKSSRLSPAPPRGSPAARGEPTGRGRRTTAADPPPTPQLRRPPPARRASSAAPAITARVAPQVTANTRTGRRPVGGAPRRARATDQRGGGSARPDDEPGAGRDADERDRRAPRFPRGGRGGGPGRAPRVAATCEEARVPPEGCSAAPAPRGVEHRRRQTTTAATRRRRTD